MFAILVAVALQASLASADIRGIRVASLPMAAPMAAPTFTFACANNNFGAGCTECAKGKLCLGTAEAADVDCTLTPSTPYCNAGQCSATAVDGCATTTAAASITCTSDGIFPDSKLCGVYHACEKANSQSDLYNCPAGYVFNPLTALCKKSSSAADCLTIKCPAASGFGTYGTSKTYYAYCLYSGSPVALTQTIMFKCPTNTLFDGTQCAYTCTKEGNFANSVDKTTYYQCSISGGKWVATLVSCPSGKQFDSTKQICVTPAV
ncbi:uncharacterized protein LOC131438744 [Malaya genurostris]|uniref:uncharacterized protein LOC131438744 n=1 Tax=Malaya genurostris TaxID=325434 RepID=UPI0026F3C1E0|nr:uncharacterized protein LOC131438744 [Malaya genurostris]